MGSCICKGEKPNLSRNINEIHTEEKKLKIEKSDYNKIFDNGRNELFSFVDAVIKFERDRRKKTEGEDKENKNLLKGKDFIANEKLIGEEEKEEDNDKEPKKRNNNKHKKNKENKNGNLDSKLILDTFCDIFCEMNQSLGEEQDFNSEKEKRELQLNKLDPFFALFRGGGIESDINYWDVDAIQESFHCKGFEFIFEYVELSSLWKLFIDGKDHYRSWYAYENDGGENKSRNENNYLASCFLAFFWLCDHFAKNPNQEFDFSMYRTLRYLSTYFKICDNISVLNSNVQKIENQQFDDKNFNSETYQNQLRVIDDIRYGFGCQKDENLPKIRFLNIYLEDIFDIVREKDIIPKEIINPNSLLFNACFLKKNLKDLLVQPEELQKAIQEELLCLIDISEKNNYSNKDSVRETLVKYSEELANIKLDNQNIYDFGGRLRDFYFSERFVDFLIDLLCDRIRLFINKYSLSSDESLEDYLIGVESQGFLYLPYLNEEKLKDKYDNLKNKFQNKFPIESFEKFKEWILRLDIAHLFNDANTRTNLILELAYMFFIGLIPPDYNDPNERYQGMNKIDEMQNQGKQRFCKYMIKERIRNILKTHGFIG
ncbi:MAG: hypothetical protein N4A49_08050 [Marinifilaceae bacterium]|jgi:hypothetical protein|nr:hypothetical protein [Marinifilaceae bacterium]